MKLPRSVAVAALVLLSLSACGGSGAIAPLRQQPTGTVVPQTRSTEITALFGKIPIPNLQIIIKRYPWDNGKVLAKGKTGGMGRIRLTGDWKPSEIICAGGTYTRGNGDYTTYDCKENFPAKHTLQFK